MFKLDMHSHTRGSDGVSHPSEIAAAALAAGLDGLCLTDHHCNTPDDNPEVYRVAAALQDVGLVAIIGVEYSTRHGHLLIYGIDVPSGAWGMYPSMQRVIDDVNALGGACVAAHPYKGYKYSLGDNLRYMRGLAAAEGINGGCAALNDGCNEKATQVANYRGLPTTGGSDAHIASDIGRVWTAFEQPIEDDADLVAQLHAGAFRPAMCPEFRLKIAKGPDYVKRKAPQPTSHRWVR